MSGTPARNFLRRSGEPMDVVATPAFRCRLAPLVVLLAGCADGYTTPIDADGDRPAETDAVAAEDARTDGDARLEAEASEDGGADDGAPADEGTETEEAPGPPDAEPDGCAPSCGGRECGDDGCGGSCGGCPDGTACNGDGHCVSTCVPRCTGRECGDDACGGSCGGCPSGQTCTATGRCVCDPAVEVVIWTSSAWNILADAFAADPSPCGQYYVSIPAVEESPGVKTNPRTGEAGPMHARGPRFHALAEFHWSGWSDVSGMTWYEKGVEFRRRMADAGYDTAGNDSWAINELPSSVRTDAGMRDNVMEAVRGLFDGPAGSTPTKGAVFVINMGHVTTYLGPYKTNLEDWLSEASFWSSVNLHVAWWAQEVYADPRHSCIPLTSVAERSTQINEFVEHFARLASVGPAAADTAQSYLGRAYVPLMNAVFNADPAAGYGDTRMVLDTMKHFVSTEVYASRAWSGTHTYPDGRIGFAWSRQSGVTDAELSELAQRLAAAVHYAYDAGGGSAAGACSPSGAYTWCQCEIGGASFNDAWETFATW